MKKKIKVEIYKNGNHSPFLLEVIGISNGSGSCFSPEELKGWCRIQSIKYETLPISLFKGENDTCHVSEDGGSTFTMSLTWVETYDL